MTKADVKTLTGICSTHISSIMLGRVKYPRESTVKLIADAIDLSTDKLYELIEETYNDNKDKRYPVKRLSTQVMLSDKKVRKRLYALGKTQKEVAAEIGMAEATFSNYMRKTHGVSKESLLKIAKGLGCDPIDIVEKPKLANDVYNLDGSTKDVETIKEYEPECVDVVVEPQQEVVTNESSNDVPIEIFKSTKHFPQVQTCTKCMFENVINVQINSKFSYHADTIQKWARRFICRMTDSDSIEYNPVMAELISEMLFNYFTNKKQPLRSDARYFVRWKKDGKIHLKRDRGEEDTIREYTISRQQEDGSYKATRMAMTDSERVKVESLFHELGVNYTMRDIADILR